jgi:hypothetical protein
VGAGGARERTNTPCPVEAFRAALCDEGARRAYEVARLAQGWVAYTAASAEALVMSARPRSDSAGGLDLVDTLLTPAQFSCLARHAAEGDMHILAALREYLRCLRDGRRDRAHALVGEAEKAGTGAIGEERPQ